MRSGNGEGYDLSARKRRDSIDRGLSSAGDLLFRLGKPDCRIGPHFVISRRLPAIAATMK
jgi:hypothetical protein